MNFFAYTIRSFIFPAAYYTRKMGNEIGGMGSIGTPFNYSCTNGHVITRVDTRSDQTLDAIKIKCSDGSESPWYGSTINAEGSIENDGGITGYDGWGDYQVNQLRLYDGATWKPFGTLTSGNRSAGRTCGPGEALNRVEGRSDYSVRKLEFWCGAFTQQQALKAARDAAAAAETAAKLAAAAAADAARVAAEKAAAEEQARVAAEKAAAEKAAAEAAAKATADAIARAAAEKVAFDAAVKAAAEKLAAEIAAKEAAEAAAKATASRVSAESAANDATTASQHANTAATASDATAAGVAARAAEQSAANAESAAASAVNPIITAGGGTVIARDGSIGVSQNSGNVTTANTDNADSNQYFYILLLLIIVIAIAVMLKSSGGSSGSKRAAVSVGNV